MGKEGAEGGARAPIFESSCIASTQRLSECWERGLSRPTRRAKSARDADPNDDSLSRGRNEAAPPPPPSPSLARERRWAPPLRSFPSA